jgi:prepilin-type N-terminal cleavage/methylation domain-containing protein
MSRRPSGFTLLEVIVALLIIGVLAAAAMPSVARAISHSGVTNSASVVAGDIEAAFSLAARQRKPVRIVFVNSTRSYTIRDRATGTVLRSRVLDESYDVHVSSLTASVASVDVFPNGLSSGPVVVTLASQGLSLNVSATRAGQVRINHP